MPPEMGSHMFKGIPHDESMGLTVYLPIHEGLTIVFLMVHVGKYAMHGCYGYNLFKAF